ncbi:MAG TPA: hypothetical protein IAA84_00500 [Candidatus Alectryocaccomicrobium excrementavium]|uniref:Uncharacterized protein n=1 Tax=Candidatus Alectryocaccomicrobium excrementavium TaxID=2840668 RepID=A0A9D1FXT9_9FIRM|nr:hypothetical protein [Candidatus Alectryocaccomicrobium excrementavium]
MGKNLWNTAHHPFMIHMFYYTGRELCFPHGTRKFSAHNGAGAPETQDAARDGKAWNFLATVQRYALHFCGIGANADTQYNHGIACISACGLVQYRYKICVRFAHGLVRMQ